MQNTGAVPIIAKIDNVQKNHPTGMVVFSFIHEYDEAGYITTEPPPSRSDVQVVVHARPVDKEPANYRICGVTLVDNLRHESDGNSTMMRATVFVSGAVLFCNTGEDPISAGDEVWVEMLEENADPSVLTIPKTFGRSLGDDCPDRQEFHYLGRCLVGSMPSHIPSKRLCFGQVLLGLQNA